tara:strand:- start:6893 stop:7780 length:888 start_codon:yes stop_codon:yes gene_type:complete
MTMARKKQNDGVLPGASLKGRALAKFVFDGSQGPAIDTAMKDTTDKIGWFPTYKGRRHVELLRTRRPIVQDFLYLAETDTDIVRIVDFPLETRFQAPTSRGLRARTHVADLALEHRDGSITFVDVEKYWHTRTTKAGKPRHHWQDRHDALVEHYGSAHGAKYCLHNETKVYPQPLFDNAKLMCEHGRRQYMHPNYEVIRSDIRRASLPATVHQLMERCSFNAQTWRYEDEPQEVEREIREINPVFSVAMQMVVDGELIVDESRRFSLETVLYATTSLGVSRAYRLITTSPIPFAA